MASTYSDEIKAQILADYAMGATKHALAKKYDVPRTTITGWIAAIEPPIPTVTDPSQKDKLGELVYEYLVTGFEALIAQNRLATDAAYLQRDGVTLPAIYNTIHAGVVSVAQAIERGKSIDDAEEASLTA